MHPALVASPASAHARRPQWAGQHVGSEVTTVKYILAVLIGILLIIFGIVGGLIDLVF